MKVGNWLLFDRDSRLHGITDVQAMQAICAVFNTSARQNIHLVGLTDKGTRVWSLDEELKEMKGHIRGLFRTKYGREMLNAHKMDLAHNHANKAW